MICDDCADATDAAPAVQFVTLADGRLTAALLGHQRCVERAEQQRQVLSFALPSCACQHRDVPRPLGTLIHDSGQGFVTSIR
jgi:hypothetical protein